MIDKEKLFYTAKSGRCGDFMPFYEDGVFHLYTIIGSNWEHLTTRDFVNYENHGVAIYGGAEDAQDRDIYSGSVMKANGIYHVFYAGHNESNREKGLPTEVVMHATSKDLFTFEKQDDVFLPPDEEIYARCGWRDPFVYFDEGTQEYRMLITGAEKHLYSKRWGTTALATSKDLKHWQVQKPLYAPFLFDSHECPDLFEIDGTWYLIFSTYTRWWETRYRMAKTPYGPWETPKDDLLDNRAFYAARTTEANGKRYLIGWTAIREEDDDTKNYLWGGSLTAHILTKRPDGTLGVAPVKEVEEVFYSPVPLQPETPFGDGKWHTSGDFENIPAIGAPDSGTSSARAGKAGKADFSAPKASPVFTAEGNGFSALPLGSLSDSSEILADVRIESGAAGIFFRAKTAEFDEWCMLRVDVKRERVFFDRFNKFFFDQHFDEERPLPLSPDGKYRVKIINYGSMILIYVNDVALSTRCYAYAGGEVGLFAEDGKAEFSSVSLLEA